MNSLKPKYDIVIIGSGFSGITAADILADYGLSILLVDENLHIGGQLLRTIPQNLGKSDAFHADYVKRIGFRFIEHCRQKKINIMSNTCLIGLDDSQRIMLDEKGQKTHAVAFNQLLLATGARERFLPFPGWTLPGVFSCGMTQIVMKSNGILPAASMVIGGSGLFLLAAAYEYLKNRGKVLAITEQTAIWNKIRFMPLLLKQWPKLIEGVKYLSKIYASLTGIHFQTKILAAKGTNYLEQVITVKTDNAGNAVSGTEKTYHPQALAISFGFSATIEAAQLAGCQVHCLPNHGGWLVKVNEQMETSVPDIYAAGEITGIGGALKSICEGRIAAYSLLHKLAKINDSMYRHKLQPLSKERKTHLKFSSLFNSLYGIHSQHLKDIPEETIICRCEDVCLKDITAAIKAGYTTPADLKTALRIGMGSCQGRTCSAIVQDILALHSPTPLTAENLLTVRPPLKPVSIAAMAAIKDKNQGENQ